MAANTHNVTITYLDLHKNYMAKCRCGWSSLNESSKKSAKSSWLQHVEKRNGKAGKITFRES